MNKVMNSLHQRNEAMKTNHEACTPAFLEAVNKHLQLVDTLGQDHPETMRAMLLVMEHAPKAFLDDMGRMAAEMGLVPQTSGYLDDGTPVVSLEDMAKHLGLSLEEAEESMKSFLADREALGLSNAGFMRNPAQVHRVQ
jgi:hypothetical protein